MFENKIVHFNSIGKLYFNSDSKLEFVPEETNFLRSSYGLPTIACTPIMRSKDYLQQPQAAATTTVVRRSKRKGTAFITPLRVAVAAAILLLFLSIPLIRSTFSNNTGTANSTLAKQSTTSSTKQVKEKQVASASILPSTPSAPIEEPIVEEEQPVETVVATPVVDENTENYIIVLGAFGKEKNAYRLADKLAKDNYLPDVTVKNGLNRVGVQLNCTAEQLANHLQFLQENYNKKAWVVD